MVGKEVKQNQVFKACCVSGEVMQLLAILHAGMVTQLTAENAALRHQLAGTGQAPAVPPASAGMQPPPGSCPPPLFAYPGPFSRPPMPGMLFPQPPLFPGAPVPKVSLGFLLCCFCTKG